MPRFAALLTVAALVALGVGVVGRARHDPADARVARAELGGEGFLPVLRLFGAWLETIQSARSPADLLVPERVEQSMNQSLGRGAAQRELQHLDWLDRFDASPQVSPKIRARVKARCWTERAQNPIACHACASAELNDIERELTSRRKTFEWVIALSTFALAALVFAAIARMPTLRRELQG